jgi:Predicted transcriptional regulator containing an HTH domain and an uncharacterized domain shared with the mammalian protein Schlafen
VFVEKTNESIFEFTPNFLVVTFTFEKGLSLPNGNDFGNDGNKYFTKIRGVILADPYVKLDDMAKQTGISKRTLSRELKKMQEAGKVQRIGTARKGYWELIE